MGETMTENDVITGDCIETLNRLPAGCADLVFADPPFNIGYSMTCTTTAAPRPTTWPGPRSGSRPSTRVLKPTGSFFLAIGDEFAAEHKVRLDALGLTLRNWIVWHYTFGVNCTKKFNRSHAPHLLLRPRSEALHLQPRRGFACPRRGRRPTPTAAPTRSANCRTTPGCCGRRRPTSTSAPSRTPGSSRVSAARSRSASDHPCQMPEGGAGADHPRRVEPRRSGARPVRRQRHDAGGGEAARPRVPRRASCRRSTPRACAKRLQMIEFRWMKLRTGRRYSTAAKRSAIRVPAVR